jgi:ankyrin repeat protein
MRVKENDNFSKFIKSIINLKDKEGFTALHLSSYQGSTPISSLLKKIGAQISDPDGNEGQNII